MNLIDLLQMTKPQAAQQQSEGLGPIMQFLSQHGGRQMPAINMPQMPDYGQQIMAHGLQKQDRVDEYAAHLQAKNDMEQQQAEHWKGSGAQLSNDPNIQALIDSGDSQKAAYGLKLAEEETQKKIAAQYNEGFSFQDFKNHPELRDLYTEYGKASAKGTTINLGDKARIPSQDAINMRNPDGTPAHILAGENWDDAKARGVYYDQRPSEDMGKTAMNVGAVLNSIGDLAKMDTSQYQPGMTKDFLGSQLKNATLPFSNDKIPFISDIGNSMMSPERQSFESANEQMIQNVIHLLTGAGVSESEAERKTRAYAFSWGDADMTKAQKTKALNALVQSAVPRTGYNQDIVKQQSSVSQSSQRQQPADISNLMQDLAAQGKDGTYKKVDSHTIELPPGADTAAFEADMAKRLGGEIVQPGSQADVAKKQADYAASHPLAKQALDVKKNSPVEKAKKEARIKELRRQAGLQ